MQLYAAVKERMEEMQLHNMSWIEVQFLKKAVDVLCQCRQTLMYTYVFAFYLRKNNQSIIFEVMKFAPVILPLPEFSSVLQQCWSGGGKGIRGL